MKRILAQIVPHIIPELKMLFFKILPLGILLSVFFMMTEAQFIIRDDFKLILYGVLLSMAGLYLMRITSYVIKKIITQIRSVIPDIYYDESKNQ
jgi:hypothetical protein